MAIVSQTVLRSMVPKYRSRYVVTRVFDGRIRIIFPSCMFSHYFLYSFGIISSGLDLFIG